MMDIATPAKTVLGFVGVGKMGLPMIEHLRSAGYRVIACDAAPAGLEAARMAGCEIATDVAACAAEVDVLLSSLPNDAAFAAVARALAASGRGSRSGRGGRSGRIGRIGLCYVDTSTVSPGVSAELAASLAESGIDYLRASVSGNPVVARAANLTVMASGPRALYDFVKPLLDTFGKTHFYLGQGEEARVIKLVINLMIAGTAGLLAEALVLGQKGGLEWAQMLDIMGKSAAGSPMVNYKVEPLKAQDYAPTFSGLQMIKDLDLIMGEAARVGVPLNLTALMRQMYQALAAQGDGELDYIATVRYMQRLAGSTEAPAQ